MEDLKKFQELLRVGIGRRSQKEIAEAANLSREYLNRLINGNFTKKPSVENLHRLSKHLIGVSLNELLESCGYDTLTLEQLIKKTEEDLTNAFKECQGNIYDDSSELVSAIEKKCQSNGQFNHANEVEAEESTPYDFYLPLSFKWTEENCICYTKYNIYCVKTLKNKIVPLYTSLDEDGDGDTGWVKPTTPRPYEEERNIMHTKVIKNFHERSLNFNTMNAEQRLLESIFGCKTWETVTLVGYGFYYQKTPPAFREFLIKHASSFCMSKEESLLYRSMVDPDSDVDDLLEEYFQDDEDEESSAGTGAAIANIMRRETGQNFFYHGKGMKAATFDKENEEDEMDNCIMVRTEETRPPKTLLLQICAYAKELGIESFGICYFHKHIPRTEAQTYYTKEFVVSPR